MAQGETVHARVQMDVGYILNKLRHWLECWLHLPEMREGKDSTSSCWLCPLRYERARLFSR